MTNQANPFMSLPEVQTYLGVKSRKTILKYIRDGKLAAYKIGGTRWRIAHDDVLAFLKREFTAIAVGNGNGSSQPQDQPATQVAP